MFRLSTVPASPAGDRFRVAPPTGRRCRPRPLGQGRARSGEAGAAITPPRAPAATATLSVPVDNQTTPAGACAPTAPPREDARALVKAASVRRGTHAARPPAAAAGRCTRLSVPTHERAPPPPRGRRHRGGGQKYKGGRLAPSAATTRPARGEGAATPAQWHTRGGGRPG